MNTGKRFQRNFKGQIWLNVASSSYVLEDFINLDNQSVSQSGAVRTVFKTLPEREPQKANQRFRRSQT